MSGVRTEYPKEHVCMGLLSRGELQKPEKITHSWKQADPKLCTEDYRTQGYVHKNTC